ncbi:hypothetical protein ACRAWD_11395 [Caulobacter segnis]
MIHHFGGRAGPWFHDIVRGIDERPRRAGPRTQVLRVGDHLRDRPLRRHAHRDRDRGPGRTGLRLVRKAGKFGRTATVKVKYADFEQVTRHRSAFQPVTDGQTLRLLAQDLVRAVYPLRAGVRLLGVTVSNLEAKAVETADQTALLVQRQRPGSHRAAPPP